MIRFFQEISKVDDEFYNERGQDQTPSLLSESYQPRVHLQGQIHYPTSNRHCVCRNRILNEHTHNNKKRGKLDHFNHQEGVTHRSSEHP